METVLTHRGRPITTDDVTFIRDLITRHSGASRWALSRLLCEAWDWKQANGALRDMVCRSMMLELHRAGEIELPPPRRQPHNFLAQRSAPAPVEVDQSPLRMRLPELGPIELRQVRRTSLEAMWNSLIETHHYLRYTQPVGEHLKYLAWARDRPVACLAFSSAPRHLGPRDRFIGWSAEARRKNIRYLAYNTRFLILPWIEVRYLASHLLGRVAREIAGDWEQLYCHPVVYLETFIDPGRFRGTCYRAANWIPLGLTTGRGKDDRTNRANRPRKEILGYPLTPRFRELLGEVS